MAHGRPIGGCADERSLLDGWSSVRRGNDCPRVRQVPRDRLACPSPTDPKMNHILLRDVGDGVEADGQAQGVGLADDASHCTFGVLFGEVVAAEVVVVDVVGEHVPDGGQGGVLDGNDCLLFTQSGHQTGVAGAEVGAFPGATGGHGGGAEGTAEPPVTVPAFTRVLSAGGLVVARADPSPGSEVGRGAEAGHVCAGLGDDDFGGGLLDPGDGHQAFNLWGERAHLLVDSRRELLDGGGQLVDARQVHAAQERVVLTKVAGQGLDQGGDLGSHPAPAISAMTCASSSPSMSAVSIARPETPRMSVATALILIPASLN